MTQGGDSFNYGIKHVALRFACQDLTLTNSWKETQFRVQFVQQHITFTWKAHRQTHRRRKRQAKEQTEKYTDRYTDGKQNRRKGRKQAKRKQTATKRD